MHRQSVKDSVEHRVRTDYEDPNNPDYTWFEDPQKPNTMLSLKAFVKQHSFDVSQCYGYCKCNAN
jgi:hypothetical protein